MKQEKIEINGIDYCITVEALINISGEHIGFIVYVNEGECKSLLLGEVLRLNEKPIFFTTETEALEYAKVYLNENN